MIKEIEKNIEDNEKKMNNSKIHDVFTMASERKTHKDRKYHREIYVKF
jgi:hypothetical protein